MHRERSKEVEQFLGLVVFKNGFCNDQELDFCCAFVDAQCSDFSVQSLHRMVPHHAKAAKELNRCVNDPLSAFGGGHLGHGGLLCDVVMVVFEPSGLVGEQLSTLNARGHLCKFGLGDLKVSQDAFEHLSAGDSLERFMHGPFGKSKSRCSDRRPENIKCSHGHFKALTRCAYALTQGNGAIFELDSCQGVCAMTSMRSAISKPGVFASTIKAEMPFAPGASPVLAKTT